MTGEVAILNDNYLYVVDRKKELIKMKGFQVHPAELEACLLKHSVIMDAGVVRCVINARGWPRANV